MEMQNYVCHPVNGAIRCHALITYGASHISIKECGGYRQMTSHLSQGPTNRQPGRPGQPEKITGQVFYFSKKPAGP